MNSVNLRVPRGWVTRALIGLNIAVFCLALSRGAGLMAGDPGVLVQLGSNYGPYTLNGQWWRLLTAMFLHFGLIHIAMNMWALYAVGLAVEQLYGSAAFLLLYLVAGLCGSLSTLLWNPVVNSAGASGAIFGVYGALFAFFLGRHSNIPPQVVAQQRNSAMGFIAYNLIFGLTQRGIDSAAHVGGLLGGGLMGFAMARAQAGGARLARGAGLGAALLAALFLARLFLPIARG